MVLLFLGFCLSLNLYLFVSQPRWIWSVCCVTRAVEVGSFSVRRGSRSVLRTAMSWCWVTWEATAWKLAQQPESTVEALHSSNYGIVFGLRCYRRVGLEGAEAVKRGWQNESRKHFPVRFPLWTSRGRGRRKWLGYRSTIGYSKMRKVRGISNTNGGSFSIEKRKRINK